MVRRVTKNHAMKKSWTPRSRKPANLGIFVTQNGRE